MVSTSFEFPTICFDYNKTGLITEHRQSVVERQHSILSVEAFYGVVHNCTMYNVYSLQIIICLATKYTS